MLFSSSKYFNWVKHSISQCEDSKKGKNPELIVVVEEEEALLT